ncbi:ABC transporter ATP-binding protein [Desulfopila sp. IMCC35008]|uniref:ABC transporter ATP-binding protein n=1 Tax=Desulfopila sp. IMCC35008 TaxID=2653858 RepID=UPI0013D8AE26|nr:ABC transporter ATP-binding protein [Desulfopila sp. IMCC35008]
MNANTCQYEVHNCRYDYPSRTSLIDINLKLHAGCFYGLIGPNGSGKTTLINLLANITRPTDGEIVLQGKSISAYSRKLLASILSLVPQNFAMEFEYSVFDVVMMGRHPYISRFGNPGPDDIQLVHEALATLDIRHLSQRYVTRLSGGERQRVLVARALAQDTSIMLLDEATASLDIKHTIDIMQALKTKVLNRNVTVIAAIHDLDLAAAFCDELLVLKDGHLISNGPVEKTLNNELLSGAFGVEGHITPTPWQQVHVQYKYTHATP